MHVTKTTVITDKIKRFLKNQIGDFSKLPLNDGITETEEFCEGCTFGVSFETNESFEYVYIFNVFWNGEYINISEHGTRENHIPDAVVEEIAEAISME